MKKKREFYKEGSSMDEDEEAFRTFLTEAFLFFFCLMKQLELVNFFSPF